MTGRVKDYYWDEICAREPEDEPCELEMLQMDAERAQERYQEALTKHSKREGSNVKPI